MTRTKLWGIYAQQPYDIFSKHVCVNADTCSHVVYLRHGYWEIDGEKYPGTERGHYKWFCERWFWSRNSLLSLSSWCRFPKACSGIFLFNFILYCLFVVLVLAGNNFPAPMLTMCKNKTPIECDLYCKQHCGTVIILSCFLRWLQSPQRIEVRKYSGNVIVTFTRQLRKLLRICAMISIWRWFHCRWRCITLDKFPPFKYISVPYP